MQPTDIWVKVTQPEWPQVSVSTLTAVAEAKLVPSERKKFGFGPSISSTASCWCQLNASDGVCCFSCFGRYLRFGFSFALEGLENFKQY